MVAWTHYIGAPKLLFSPGGKQMNKVVIAPIPEDTLEDECSLSLILIRDGKEALIGERLDTAQAQASWTENPALVSIAEHHLVRGGRRRFLVSVE